MTNAILVTGASGYVGRHCASHLADKGYTVVRGSRYPQPFPTDEIWASYGGGVDPSIVKSALTNCHVVVHCAGQSHVHRDQNSFDSAWLANVDFTRVLAEQSARAGVRHFIFISSALVVAGSRDAAGNVDCTSPPSPTSHYAETKLAAENVLADVSAATGLRVTILRPPMVYGPAAKGNFARLVKLVRRGAPLPLAGATGAKSFIFIDNLSSAITAAVAKTPPAGKSTFLVSDGEITTTADMIRAIAAHANRKAKIFPLPRRPLHFAFASLGLIQEWDKLFAPFVIDSRAFCDWSGWSAPVNFNDAIRLSITQTPQLFR